MPNEETNHKDNAASNKEKEKKHDSGAADLEKVTDYAEEKEIGSSSAAEDAIAVISMIFQELKSPKKCLPLFLEILSENLNCWLTFSFLNRFCFNFFWLIGIRYWLL